MDTLNSQQRSLGWGLGAAQQDQLSKQAAGLIRLYQLLLFTMPGTPVFTYGDEIGLQAGQVSYKTEQMLEQMLQPLQSVTFCLSPSFFCFLLRVHLQR